MISRMSVSNMGRTASPEALMIPANIGHREAWQLLASKLPGSQYLASNSTYHPFSAFEFDIIVKSSSIGRIGVLVDAMGGSVSTISEWPETRSLSETERNALSTPVLDLDAARVQARRASASRVMRKLKIGKLFTLFETRTIEILWKPNWMVELVWRDQDVRVLVDGLDGSYYVASMET